MNLQLVNKLKLSISNSPKLSPKNGEGHSSLSSHKPSKAGTETESDFKVKRTVFKDYKECVKLPIDVRKQQRDNLKRGSLYSNVIENQQYDNALIEQDKPKPEPNRIIKKIAESLDAWHANRKMKNSRNQDLGIFVKINSLFRPERCNRCSWRLNKIQKVSNSQA